MSPKSGFETQKIDVSSSVRLNLGLPPTYKNIQNSPKYNAKLASGEDIDQRITNRLKRSVIEMSTSLTTSTPKQS